jgi:hypothetical protein
VAHPIWFLLNQSAGGGAVPDPEGFLVGSREYALYHNAGAVTFGAVGGQSGNGSGTEASADDADGLWHQFTTGAVSGNTATLQPADTFNMIRREWLPTTVIKIKTGPSIAALRIHVGHFPSNPAATTLPNNGSGFRYDTAVDGTVFWRTITNGGGAGLVTATTAAIAVNTVYLLKIVQSAANIEFYVNGVLVSTHASELPVAADEHTPVITVATQEAAAKSIRWGYTKIRYS